MGLFGWKCEICGNDVSLNKVMVKGKKYVCFDCCKAAGYNPLTWMGSLITSAEEIEDRIKNGVPEKPALGNKPLFSNFKRNEASDGQEFQVTKTVANWIKIDEVHQLWFTQSQFGVKKSPIHAFSDVLSFELLEDGDSITKGGLGRAAVGAITFGGVGAIVGGVTGKRRTKTNCTSMRIKITLNDMKAPVEYIDLINMKTARNSALYKRSIEQANEILAVLQVMCEMNKSTSSVSQPSSAADEIRKFKELLDQGIITLEEFNTKKKQLLDL